MRTAWSFILATSILFSCRSKDSIPADILPKPKMQAMLWDMMRADQFLGDFVFNKDTSINHDSASIRLYARILAIHHVSQKQFRESFDYYNLHPALLKTIMDSISVNATLAPTVIPVTNDTVKPVVQPKQPKPDSVFKPRNKKQLKVE